MWEMWENIAFFAIALLLAFMMGVLVGCGYFDN